MTALSAYFSWVKTMVFVGSLLAQTVLAVEDLGSVLENQNNLTTFTQLIKDHSDILLQLPSYAGVTIIAPSDKAFENIPYTSLNEIWDPEDSDKTVSLLQYHVLKGTVAVGDLNTGPTYLQSTLLTNSVYTNVTEGQNVLLNKQPAGEVILTSGMGTRCTLIEKDISFQGGMIQIVDNLLLPPTKLSETTQAFQAESFLASLYAVDAVPEADNTQNITVFVPEDAAIQAVGGTLENLDADNLSRIVNYHIVPNRVLSSAMLTNGSVLGTMAKDASGANDETLTVRQAGNNKFVNSAQIVQPDILIANGVMHIISGVLNPDADSVAPNPTMATQAPVFSLSSADHPFTSALPCTEDCPVTTSSTATVQQTTSTTTSVSSRTSDGAAAGARCTALVAGGAMGMLGVGVGMAWL